MSLILPLAIIAVLAAWGAGLAFLAVTMRRHRSWHPGDDTPEVPADSPLRTWHT